MCSAPGARAQHQLSDSLQQALAHTADPEDRVQLLLNLKDINEDSNLNLAYSVIGRWGEKGATIIRILDFDKSQQIRSIT